MGVPQRGQLTKRRRRPGCAQTGLHFKSGGNTVEELETQETEFEFQKEWFLYLAKYDEYEVYLKNLGDKYVIVKTNKRKYNENYCD